MPSLVSRSLILSLLVALAVAFLVSAGRSVPAQESLSAAETDAVRGVISRQLEAFQVDDGSLAFSFASPILQQKFGNPGVFMEMVRSGYDPVYRPAEVEFQDTLLLGETVVQRVLFVDRAGKAWMARYTMMRMADGSWRIAGVRLEALPDLST